MSVETTIYLVHWERLTAGLNQSGTLDFFWEALDDQTEGADTEGVRWIEETQEAYVESWRWGMKLGEMYDQIRSQLDPTFESTLSRFIFGLALVCDERERQFTPVQDLGPEGSYDECYFGSLSPDSVHAFCQLAAALPEERILEQLAAAPKVQWSPEDDRLGLQGFSETLAALISTYRRLLERAHTLRWGILLLGC